MISGQTDRSLNLVSLKQLNLQKYLKSNEDVSLQNCTTNLVKHQLNSKPARTIIILSFLSSGNY
jgi:hypothetical protein